MCSSTDDLTLNYGLHSPQDLMLFFFLLQHDSPNKLLLALRWMSFPGTHRGWFDRVHTTVCLEERYQKPPPSATQVAKRTSVLCKLTRTSLSERGMSGMWPYGQRAREPVIRLVLLPEPDNKGLLVQPSPPLGSLWSRNFFLRSYDSDLLVGQLGTTLVQTYQLSRCPRVLIFWFVTSYWAYFVI